LETIGHKARMTVSDTGVSIDARFLPAVFDRFTGSHVLDEDRPGLGLDSRLCDIWSNCMEAP
jgi:signal transduction histidine kinase